MMSTTSAATATKTILVVALFVTTFLLVSAAATSVASQGYGKEGPELVVHTAVVGDAAAHLVQRGQSYQVFEGGKSSNRKSSMTRRMMIGSTMPTCTYNECRGCKYKCLAQQVPVEGNDPIHSAYHYRCVCHR